jgi:sec-independent protein translocase protein TatC
MGLFKELKKFGKSILLWLYFFAGLSVFFFGFGFKKIEILERNFFLPFPTLHSFSVHFFKYLQQNLLPPQVQVVVISPLNAFLAQVIIALFLGFIFTFPLLLCQIIKYISPALYKHEKKALFKVLIPSVVLFAVGCLFAYFILIPPTFKILYSFAFTLGAVPLFTAREFVTLTLALIVAVGIMFQIPIFMILLSYLGFVNASFWKKNWRYIFVAFLIFSAIITPDGTGVTMMLLFFPLVGLYFLGYILAPGKK